MNPSDSTNTSSATDPSTPTDVAAEFDDAVASDSDDVLTEDPAVNGASRKPRRTSANFEDLSSISDMALHAAREAELYLTDKAASKLEDRGWAPVVRPFTGYGSNGWVRIMCRVLLGRPEDRRHIDSLARGWRNFVSLPLQGHKVTVKIGGETFEVTTDDDGLVDERLAVELEPGWHTYELCADGAISETGQVRIIGPEPQTALLSDIDDTVLVTSLPRPMLAAWNTFVLNEHARRPVPGMAVLYERISQKYDNPPVFYLSTGAWNVAPTLRRFLSRNLYPAGPLLLTDWGPSDTRWFRSGQEHKVRQLVRLAAELPQLRWILVGDDGQHDEGIYSHFARRYNDIVAGVAIRNLSPTELVLANGVPQHRYTQIPEGTTWVHAPNGAEMAKELEKVGLL